MNSAQLSPSRTPDPPANAKPVNGDATNVSAHDDVDPPATPPGVKIHQLIGLAHAMHKVVCLVCFATRPKTAPYCLECGAASPGGDQPSSRHSLLGDENVTPSVALQNGDLGVPLNTPVASIHQAPGSAPCSDAEPADMSSNTSQGPVATMDQLLVIDTKAHSAVLSSQEENGQLEAAVSSDAPDTDPISSSDLADLLALACAMRKVVCLRCHAMNFQGEVVCVKCGASFAVPTSDLPLQGASSSAEVVLVVPNPVVESASNDNIHGRVRTVCRTCFATAAAGNTFCIECGENLSLSVTSPETKSTPVLAPSAVVEPEVAVEVATTTGSNHSNEHGDMGPRQGDNINAASKSPDGGTRPADVIGGQVHPDDGSANNNAPPPPDVPSSSKLHADTIVYGATIVLRGFVPPSGDNDGSATFNKPEGFCPVAFRPLVSTGFGKSNEPVLTLVQANDCPLPLAQFVVYVMLPPPGDKNARLGKTSVHFLQKVVLAIAPSVAGDPTHSLPGGVNDFIGTRPRLQPDHAGPTKGELHVMFVQTDHPTSTQKLATGMANITIRVVDSNRLRETYTAQDVGFCVAAGGKSSPLVVGHEKSLMEFAKKVHPSALTFRVERVKDARQSISPSLATEQQPGGTAEQALG
ncbi:hypothetical protein DYB31_001934 [Aphanomyces astaci]|uniref:Uncharacterized protein n=1 Tax=Aphanomyces astaci TaxID=112090 RepID=A0A397EHA1_APHAT|nr:hypothetical protein DYB31_001934 [Aphanomyces astaci]